MHKIDVDIANNITVKYWYHLFILIFPTNKINKYKLIIDKITIILSEGQYDNNKIFDITTGISKKVYNVNISDNIVNKIINKLSFIKFLFLLNKFFSI